MRITQIYGKNVVLGYIRRFPEKVKTVFTVDDRYRSDLPKKHRGPRITSKDLSKKLGEVRHQGIMAEVYLPNQGSVYDVTMGDLKTSCVVVLDQIQDSGNYGAIYRSAAGMAVDAIITAKDKQAPRNAKFLQSAAGTFGVVPEILVSNISETIKKLQEFGYFAYGLMEGVSSQPLARLELNQKTAFVVGNEHEGLRRLVAESCDILVKLPMSLKIESYNASVAGALAMYTWRMQFPMK